MSNKYLHIILFVFSTLFLFSCASKSIPFDPDQPIIGKWKVVDATILPFEHISHCDKLLIGSLFQFNRNQELIVTEHLGTTCNEKQSYQLTKNSFEILESDMIFSYAISKLNKDTLAFTIDRVPSYLYNDSIDGDEMQVKLDFIRKNGIRVTCERI